MEYKEFIKILKNSSLKGKGQFFNTASQLFENDYGIPQTQEELDYIKNPMENLDAIDIAKMIGYQTAQGLRTAVKDIGLYSGDTQTEDQRDFYRSLKRKPIPDSMIDRQNANLKQQQEQRKQQDADGTTARWTFYITEIPRLEQLYTNKTGTDPNETLYLPFAHMFGSDDKYNKLIQWGKTQLITRLKKK